MWPGILKSDVLESKHWLRMVDHIRWMAGLMDSIAHHTHSAKSDIYIKLPNFQKEFSQIIRAEYKRKI